MVKIVHCGVKEVKVGLWLQFLILGCCNSTKCYLSMLFCCIGAVSSSERLFIPCHDLAKTADVQDLSQYSPSGDFVYCCIENCTVDWNIV